MRVQAICFNEMGVWPDAEITEYLQTFVDTANDDDTNIRTLLAVCMMVDIKDGVYECWLPSIDAEPSVCWIDVCCNETFDDPYIASLKINAPILHGPCKCHYSDLQPVFIFT